MNRGSEESEEDVKALTRVWLCDILKECPSKGLVKKFEFLEDRVYDITKCERKVLERKLSLFKSQYKSKWTAARYIEGIFRKQNLNWLQGTVKIPKVSPRKDACRPSKSFLESSDRSKRRKTKGLREVVPTAQLVYATQMSLRACGKVDASKVVKDVTCSPRRAKKYRQSLASSQTQRQLTPTEALSMFVEADLTRRQYNITRSANKERFPCYLVLQKEKFKCYPVRESFTVTATCAELELQDLLDHTTTRLCLHLKDVLERIL